MYILFSINFGLNAENKFELLKIFLDGNIITDHGSQCSRQLEMVILAKINEIKNYQRIKRIILHLI